MSQITRESIRTENGLVLISRQDEGLGWRRIANGVYGFSYTPASKDGGMFSKNSLLSFEMHKRSDGSLHVIAYADAEEAEKLKSPGAPEVRVFPAATELADQLLVIPHARIGISKELDRSNKNMLRFTLKPVE